MMFLRLHLKPDVISQVFSNVLGESDRDYGKHIVHKQILGAVAIILLSGNCFQLSGL